MTYAKAEGRGIIWLGEDERKNAIIHAERGRWC